MTIKVDKPQHTTVANTCERCVHWRPCDFLDDDQELPVAGHCHRWAPRPEMSDIAKAQRFATFPRTPADCGCGEFKSA